MPADFLAVPYKETGFLNVADAIDRYLKSIVSKAVLRSRRAILQNPCPPLPPTPPPPPPLTHLQPALRTPRPQSHLGTDS